MAASQQLAALDRALKLSQQMRLHAEQGDWAEVVELEQQRQPIIAKAMAVSSETLAAAIEQKIEQILSYDQQLHGLVLAARNEAGAELARMNNGRQATKAYQQHSGR